MCRGVHASNVILQIKAWASFSARVTGYGQRSAMRAFMWTQVLWRAVCTLLPQGHVWLLRPFCKERVSLMSAPSMHGYMNVSCRE